MIDSNAVIDYLKGTIPPKGMAFMHEVINDIPKVSVITKIEILGFNTTAEAYKTLVGFFEDAVVILLTDEIVEKTIELRKSLMIKLPDAIIAATALLQNRTLISRNIKDFDKVDGLEVVNPFDL